MLCAILVINIWALYPIILLNLTQMPPPALAAAAAAAERIKEEAILALALIALPPMPLAIITTLVPLAARGPALTHALTRVLVVASPTVRTAHPPTIAHVCAPLSTTHALARAPILAPPIGATAANTVVSAAQAATAATIAVKSGAMIVIPTKGTDQVSINYLSKQTYREDQVRSGGTQGPPPNSTNHTNNQSYRDDGNYQAPLNNKNLSHRDFNLKTNIKYNQNTDSQATIKTNMNKNTIYVPKGKFYFIEENSNNTDITKVKETNIYSITDIISKYIPNMSLRRQQNAQPSQNGPNQVRPSQMSQNQYPDSKGTLTAAHNTVPNSHKQDTTPQPPTNKAHGETKAPAKDQASGELPQITNF